MARAAASKRKEPARKRKAEDEEPSQEVQQVERPVKRRQAAHQESAALHPIEHASHSKVPGEVFVFGDGDCGQLGLGEEVTERLRPFPISVDGKKVLQIVCGGMHTVALTEDRQIYSWGVNDEGALGRKTAGELWEKSGQSSGKPGDSYVPSKVAMPKGAGTIVQLSAGDSHTCALTELGAVWAWGTYRDASGVMGFSKHTRIQLTPTCVYEPRKAEEQIVRIASGADHAAGVTASGALLTWGNGQQGQLGRVGERLSDRVKMETLLAPHPVPFKRVRGVKSSRIVDVNCGTYATFATTVDGHIFGFGLNNYGQLALPGQVPVYAPTLVKALEGKGVTLVRSGQHHTLALTQEGSLLSFGRPTYGRLGQKDADVSADAACPEPKPVDGLEGVRVAGAAAGLAVSGCFSEEGDAYLWGFGTSNQLGKGDDDEDEVAPKKLAETKKFAGQKVVALEFGGQHAALLCVPR